MAMKWEYKVVVQDIGGWVKRKLDPNDMEQALTQHGKDGWELVSVTPLAGNQGSTWGSLTVGLVCTFKRPVQS